MAIFSYTYTLTNGQTADADEVMQNFTDVRNGITDGTKDISVAALTVAGTATLNGAVTLGNSSTDDITFTGSMASTLNIKTTNSYNIGGSTTGLAGLYLGNAGSSTTIRVVSAASVASSATYTIPDVGTTGNFIMSEGTQTISGAKTFDEELIVGNTSTVGMTVNFDGSQAAEYGIQIVSTGTTLEGDGASTGGFIYLDGSSDTSSADDSGFDFISGATNAGEVFSLDGRGRFTTVDGVVLGNGGSLLNYYEEASDANIQSQTTLNNIGSGGSLTFYYTRVGRLVNLTYILVTGSSGTGNQIFPDAAIIDSQFRPTGEINNFAIHNDQTNGVQVSLRIRTNGQFDFFCNDDADYTTNANFPTSTTYRGSVSYTVYS